MLHAYACKCMRTPLHAGRCMVELTPETPATINPHPHPPVQTPAGDSLDAWSTRQYDYYQRILNGIL